VSSDSIGGLQIEATTKGIKPLFNNCWHHALLVCLINEIMKIAVDIMIIGSGLAGMSLALRLPKHIRIALVDRRTLHYDSASWYAQGGIAAAIASSDSLEKHWQDTASAGGGLSEASSGKQLLGQAPAAIAWLAKMGVPFSKTASGELALGQEGGHLERRIVHVSDRTGFFVSETLQKHIAAATHIQKLYGHILALRQSDGRGSPCQGAWLYAENGEVLAIDAPVVVLATGGLSALYQQTTVPKALIGSGLWLAAQAGAALADLEFVQFHPTALQVASGRAPLLSEALRGEGAWLLTPTGQRFMPDLHPQAELAPRDIVARAIQEVAEKAGQVFLSLQHLDGDFVYARFPGVAQLCREHGFDLAKDLLPVLPAAHYTCGGIRASAEGETEVPGLFAIGECACTGLHGANRLASNSLLECVSMAFLLAERLANTAFSQPPQSSAKPLPPMPTALAEADFLRLRTLLQSKVGVFREAKGLGEAEDFLRQLGEAQNHGSVMLALALVQAAAAREESRGCHYRADFPESYPEAKHSLLRFNPSGGWDITMQAKTSA
jgi:L-aspartate oxidase